MKKGLTEIVFIIDRSGSMAGLEEATISGFNEMINKQKFLEGEAFVSTVLFDDRYSHNKYKSLFPVFWDHNLTIGRGQYLQSYLEEFWKSKK